MKKRVLLVLILALWTSLFAGLVFGITRAGYPMWAALPSAYLVVVLLNGSLAYWYLVRRLKLEGKKAPGYLQYIFLPKRISKLGEDAIHRDSWVPPWSNQSVSGFVRLCAGFLVLCCVFAITVSVYMTIVEGMRVDQLPSAIAGFFGVGYMAWLFGYAAILGKAPVGWLPARQMKSMPSRPLALTCLLMFTVSDHAQEPVSVATLPTGKQLKVISVGKVFFTEAEPALMLNYQTDLPIDNLPALEKEVDEIWAGFRIEVERAGLSTGVVRANEKTSGFIVTKSRGYGFVYQRDSNGKWARLPSKPTK